ncbi:sigma-70 family RNA polymerase sigma factor [Myceligenerans indicum]|uniref:Sigma-70 family RNA polymerase sigma factor n=1 Tax=Myceligenerans indicum TaxID=2593663 RepID=A0ABS1LJR1_9MICO|nr:sigma-70 family RNA polymerase sigma factor [Myceligenerans indicum]MBL0886269.1 sigma-70 family RNA polymerase sigma factor [Myceligenerans indicum]
MRAGDQAVLRDLHDRHAAAVWRYVVRLTGTTTGADDIVQETLLRAWRSPRLARKDPDAARAWMLTVARNLVIDDARSARRRHETVVESLPDHDGGGAGDRTDELFDAILVAEALGDLTEDHRAVIAHAYFGGRSTAELAELLDVPEGTVKSRLHYGLRALRLALQERGVVR